MSKTLESIVLRRAVDLIDDRTRWTRDALARDKWGHECDLLAPKAQRWCAMGALYKASYEVIGDQGEGFRLADKILRRILLHGGWGLAQINDHQGRKAALHALRGALEKAN